MRRKECSKVLMIVLVLLVLFIYGLVGEDDYLTEVMMHKPFAVAMR